MEILKIGSLVMVLLNKVVSHTIFERLHKNPHFSYIICFSLIFDSAFGLLHSGRL